jgi:hypothetical protein
MRKDDEIRIRCDSCRDPIFIERDKYALDKYGDALCHDCHVHAVLLLKAKYGVDWEGQTFGYELGPIVAGGPGQSNENPF